jgi:hypothetical protein
MVSVKQVPGRWGGQRVRGFARLGDFGEVAVEVFLRGAPDSDLVAKAVGWVEWRMVELVESLAAEGGLDRGAERVAADYGPTDGL